MWNLKVFNLQLHKTKESIKFSHLRNWNQPNLACLIDGLHKIIWRFIVQSSGAFKARANFWYPPKAELQGAKSVRWWDEVKFNGRRQEQMCCVKVEISQVRLKITNLEVDWAQKIIKFEPCCCDWLQSVSQFLILFWCHCNEPRYYLFHCTNDCY